ncbi:iron ABC transporter permease [Flavobacterium gawalongense]|uniref:Iron ABC transporter permease n=1 Tax=Flavobacterium gawalongense TaxID=2594432 RepID=A0A553BA36_9FLAO|nr:iron ABC transporter permease [Flavobacterium gawalongense]TRW97109.1 iron ABC transporter permease [Flavobacterium gawalongense]TRX01805.1 iron ABC transporter permease [Flavobacterium gawalongense]TRX05099.1 iron ABC transporter permease [Flavobacterium gawalongense]TRX05960.1 iron ABC transporter permease [Flavobacterium gawalongense]TRX21787.1 iron ABC transporter permease [Flavobacterium gawalongense]
MNNQKRNTILFILIGLGLIIMFFLNISLGSITIPFKEIYTSLTGSQASKSTWEYIIINYRLPKAITAVLVGMGLSISGLLMQTLFRNPLAGPDVLGLSSGASLGVAFVILSASLLPPFLSTLLLSSYGVVLASTLGSTAVLLLVLLVSQRLRDTMAILIVGLMFGSFTSAIVGVLTYFSSAEQLQKFTFWSLGNLGNLSWTSILILSICVGIGLLLSIFSIKSLNALLLGENYARSLGLNFKKARLIIIFATSILAGSITAYAGPIAFIGLAVPHIAKLIFKTSDHSVLYWSTLFLGAAIMLICDVISQMPGMEVTLPINAVTSIIGAPIVIWLLVRKRKMMG